MPKPVTIGQSGFRKNLVEQLLSGWSQESAGAEGQMKPLSDSYYAEIAATLAQSMTAEQILAQMVAMQETITDPKDLQSFNYNASQLLTELLKANPNMPAYKAIGDRILDPNAIISEKHSQTLQHFNKLFPRAVDNVADVNVQKIFVPIVNNSRKQAETVTKGLEQHEAAFAAPPVSNSNRQQLMQKKNLSLNSKELDAEVKKAAADLLNINMLLLSRVPLNELHNLPTAKVATRPLAPNAMRLINYSNNFSNQVRDDFLLCQSLTELKNTYLFYAKLLDECIKNRNFNAAQSIINGFSLAPIERISKLIVLDPKVLALIQKNSEVMNMNSNFANYRKAAASSDAFYMPSIAVLLRDLTFIYEGNPDIHEENNVENLSKLKLAADVFQPLQANQQKISAISPTQYQTEFAQMVDSPVLEERIAYNLSLAIAPRPKSLTQVEIDQGVKPTSIEPFSKDQKPLIEAARNEALNSLHSVQPSTVVASSSAATSAGPNATTQPLPVPPAPPVPDAAAQAPQQPQAATPVVTGASLLPPRPKMNTRILSAPPPLVPPPPLPEKPSVPTAASSVPTAPKDVLPPHIDALKTKLSQIVAIAVLGSQDQLVVQAKSCLNQIDQIQDSPGSSTGKSRQYANLLDNIKNDNNIDIYIRKLIDPSVTAENKPAAAAPKKAAASKKPPLLLRAFMKGNKEKTPKLTELASKTTVAREADVDADRKPTNKGRGRR